MNQDMPANVFEEIQDDTADQLLCNLTLQTLVTDTDESRNRSATGAVVVKIEKIFQLFAEIMLDESKKKLVIGLKSRPRVKTEGSDERGKNSKLEYKAISFPSNSANEAWKFSKIKIISNDSVLTGA